MSADGVPVGTVEAFSDGWIGQGSGEAIWRCDMQACGQRIFSQMLYVLATYVLYMYLHPLILHGSL